jgi:hypothetical protein
MKKAAPKPPPVETMTVQVIKYDDLHAILEKKYGEKIVSLQDKINQQKAEIKELKRQLKEEQGTQIGELRRRIRADHSLLSTIAHMDNALYSRPSDWHLALEIVQRCQRYLEDKNVELYEGV